MHRCHRPVGGAIDSACDSCCDAEWYRFLLVPVVGLLAEWGRRFRGRRRKGTVGLHSYGGPWPIDGRCGVVTIAFSYEPSGTAEARPCSWLLVAVNLDIFPFSLSPKDKRCSCQCLIRLRSNNAAIAVVSVAWPKAVCLLADRWQSKNSILFGLLKSSKSIRLRSL